MSSPPKGNTKGVAKAPVIPEGTSAAAASPPVKPATPQEVSFVDDLQLLLDVAGMLPGVGALPDLLNSAISLARGNFIDAAFSAASAIPAAGDIVGAGKIAKNAEKYLNAVERVSKKAKGVLPDVVSKKLDAGLAQLKQQLQTLKNQAKEALSSANKAPANKSSAKHEHQEGKNKSSKDNNGNGGQDGGGRSAGPDASGPCILGTYRELKTTKPCPKGSEAHHIIPDTMVRVTRRKAHEKGQGTLIGRKNFWDGPAICLVGKQGEAKSEHNMAHQLDNKIRAMGASSQIPGTLPFNVAIPIAIEHAIKARPECAKQILAEIKRAYPRYKKDSKLINAAFRPPVPGSDAWAALEGDTVMNQSPKTTTQKSGKKR